MAKALFSNFQDELDYISDETFSADGLTYDDAVSDANVSGWAPTLNALPTGSIGGSAVTAAAENFSVPAASLDAGGAPTTTIPIGATVEIDGNGTNAVIFTGSTGTLKLDHSVAFGGQIKGFAGHDTIDLADISYGVQTRANFVGDASGGTLTITDGVHSANIALQGNYLSSSWNLANDGNGGTTVVDPTWQTLKVGAGGWVTGVDIAPDGTMVGRTDTYGAYIWNGTQWQQLVTATSMPAAFTTQDAIQPMYGQQGVDEIRIAPSNTSIMYMMYDGYVFKTIDKGTTWTQLASFNGGVQVASGSNDPQRMDGQRMAIDPNNSNVVYVGTTQNGLFVTTDGGSTWSSVSSIPVSTQVGGVYPGITGIVFDPAGNGVSGGKTTTIFASSWGNGVYESTDAGASWSRLAGGPSNVLSATVSSTGVYYAIGDDGNDLWSYSNNTWRELLTPAAVGGNSLQAVAINPLNPAEIVTITGGGALNISYDGGATWSGDNWTEKLASSDIPWLTLAGTMNQYMAVGGMQFSTTVPNQLIVSDGIGVWNTTIPTANFAWNTPVTWNSQSAGIEQLVAWQIVSPPGGSPVLASMDRAFFQITDPNSYPSTYGPVMGVTTATGYSLDYASSTPSFLVGIAEWGTDQSGYSSDGGKTWTQFQAKIPGAAVTSRGGTIAASSPTNIIWAEAGGHDPYYTLDGGQTWNPIILPGVSDWSNFDASYYTDTRTVAADRVLANTFYLYYPGNGVFESTNGGVSWSNVFSGSISPTWQDDSWGSSLQSVPGEAGNLFFTAGSLGGPQPDGVPFYRSTDGGAHWSAVANVQDVYCFGYGAASPGQSYPAIYIVGYVNSLYGVWQSNDNAQSWTQIGTDPNNSIDSITTISGDANVYGQVYVGFSGSGYAILTAAPSVSGVTASSVLEAPSAGDLNAGNIVTLTLNFTSALTVAGSGTPTLTLNDGGVATYSGGSGTNALTFTYIVSAGQNTTSLAATGVSLNGATMQDASGNAANLSLTSLTQAGPQIDTTAPVISAISESPANGDLNAGKTVVYTLTMSEAVTVNTSGGTPTLALNDSGIATYTGGSGSTALTFSYTVQAGQNTPDLMVSTVNLNGGTILDGAGNAANVSVSGLTQGSPQIDTTPPVISAISETPANGDLNAGKTVVYTLTMSEAVTVNTSGGTPTLALNDGGIATYTGGSGSTALTFSYTVQAGQNTPDLMVSTVNLNGGTIADGAGNAANVSVTGLTQGSPQIDTTAPTVSSVMTSGSGITAGSGNLSTGSVVTLTVNLSEVVTVTGAPTLSLNDGGVASYAGGSGTNALTFTYTVLPGQTTPDLAVTAVNLGTASIVDGAGNAANFAGALTNPAGVLQVNNTTTIEAFGSTALVQTGNNYFLNPVAGGTGPELKYGGVAFTANSTWGAWAPIGVEAISGGYEVAFKIGTNTFTVWDTDTNGNLTSIALGTSSGNSTTLKNLETSFHQDLNGDGTIGPPAAPASTTIEAYGSTALVQGGNNYFLNPVAGGTGPELKYGGVAFTTNSTWGAWAPVGVEAISGGYEVAFKIGTNIYTVWDTDTNGNLTSIALGTTLSGSSTALENLETSFHQDLNGDGTIGPASTTIEAYGSTALVQTGNNYFLNPIAGGTGPELKYGGVAFTTNSTWGAWAPVGVEAISGGYEVAFKIGTNIYTVWDTDTNGNLTSIALGTTLSGSSTALENLETSFHQDLNGDGTIGPASTTIEAYGSTALVQIGNNYFLNPVTGGTGPELKYGGVAFTANSTWGAWAPIGVEAISGGYEVAFKTGTDTYAVWDTDANGNLTTVALGTTSGSSTALEGLEPSFQQDLNGDGAIGVNLAHSSVLASTAPISVAGGATVEISTPFGGQVTFDGSSGTLKLDNSSSFFGTVAGMSGQDTIDFADMNFATLQQPSFSSNSSGGTLTITDGTHAANIALLGNYMASAFVASSDGHGGTYLVDPTAVNQNTLASSHA